MKYIIVFLTFLTFLNCTSKAEEKWVSAKYGLSMRAKNSINSMVITTLPYKAIVTIERKSTAVLVVNKKKGSWVFVKWRNKKGWVFDFYLSKSKPIKAKEKSKVYVESEVYIINKKSVEFIANGLIPAVFYDIDELYNKLGKPKKSEHTMFTNKHDSKFIDRVYSYFYNGAFVKLYYASYDKKYICVDISYKKNISNLLYGIKIGMKKTKIISILGKPDTKKPNSIIYYDPRGFGSSASFYFQAGILQKIEWDSDVD